MAFNNSVALEAGPTEVLITLNANISEVTIRNELLEGEEHWVVPCVMAVEGVLAANLGALYYPEEELSKKVSAWNHKPVVVYHPSKPVSACDPMILNAQKIGVILNTSYSNSKLKAELWINKERADDVDSRIRDAVENKTTLEVSTGLEVEIEETAGVFNSKDYIGIARNYTPDHLAILPDQVGASSIKDGAGFIQNSKGEDITEKVVRMMGAHGLSLNELSHSEVSRKLYDALSMRFKELEKEKLDSYGVASDCEKHHCYGIWVVEVYDEYFIYESGNKYYKLSYTQSGDTITIGETPEKVERKISYVATNASAKETNKIQNNMNRKDKVTALIANGSFTEEDREMLEGMSDASFERIDTLATNAASAQKQEKDEPKDDSKNQVAANADTPKVPTLDEYISNAPEEVRTVINEGISSLNKEKTDLITSIVANKNNSFEEAELKVMSLNQLRKMASLATNQETRERKPYAQPMGDAPRAHNSGSVEGLSVPSTSIES